MFQSYDLENNPDAARGRLAALRRLMAERGCDAFLVPHSDEYMSEYLPPCAKRLEWLTGFSGSAGFAIILAQQAVLFTDGRYHLQVRQQTDPVLFHYADLISAPPAAWLRAYAQARKAEGALPAGGLKIAYDPRLHSLIEADALRAAVAPYGALIPVAENPVDAIWRDRPAPPCGAVSRQPLELAGRSASDKLAELRGKITAARADFWLITEPTGLAWLFNLRGQDVEHTPIALGYALIPRDSLAKAQIFMNKAKFGSEIAAELAELAEIVPPQQMPARLAAAAKGRRIMADERSCAEAFRLAVQQAGGALIAAANPLALPRAIKTQAEQDGARRAHRRDGVAMVRFLAELERQIAARGAESMNEIAAAELLEQIRRDTAAESGSRLEDISFDTISGIGADGAIIHYRVSRASNQPFRAGALYLVDSGGQYRDGTTDITRTIAIGPSGAEEKRCFTLVLKGMISLSMARFPQGTRGRDLDILARNALWQNGYNYAHGTGHGVGSFLSVHEGPQTISPAGAQALLPGMIISNEPGYYREGAFGIRIENLLLTQPAEPIAGGDMPMLAFETLTLCPIDRRLIDTALLEAAELDWLNAYHARICAELSPHLNEADRAWLRTSCAYLSSATNSSI